ncbi:MAG: hypothetical protein V2I36_09680 [Desulfopila sp.]|jgi:hypothetical protein|nr:hypothetical protein [Desulfopila sp.]
MAIVFLGLQPTATSILSKCLHQNGKETESIDTIEQFNTMLSQRPDDVEAVIADDAELIALKNLIMRNPMLNMGLISPRSTNEFHEATEGYGILMQLSSPPTKEDGMSFLAKLESLAALYPAPKSGEMK